MCARKDCAVKEGHNLRHSFRLEACNLLKVNSTLVDSQSSNPGSIPGSATKFLLIRGTQKSSSICRVLTAFSASFHRKSVTFVSLTLSFPQLDNGRLTAVLRCYNSSQCRRILEQLTVRAFVEYGMSALP